MAPAHDTPMSYDEHSEKNNDLGGIPMFRGIDLPEAYRFPSYHPPAVSRETLQE